MIMIKQQSYCNKNKVPMFVSINGKCWNCNKEIPDTDKKLITGCPFCNRTFCD